ncbi:MAG: hypothetical protein OXG24_09490 [Gammaproteobacteria bacterium]|nr:hypothetical protein [Gammaproteobacteria bacterium]
MDLVSKFRAIMFVCVTLVSLAALGETETPEAESSNDEAQEANEAQADSEDRVIDEKLDEVKDEEGASSDTEKSTDSAQSEPYTRLPVQSRIGPNQNVDLPQDI